MDDMIAQTVPFGGLEKEGVVLVEQWQQQLAIWENELSDNEGVGCHQKDHACGTIAFSTSKHQ